MFYLLFQVIFFQMLAEILCSATFRYCKQIIQSEYRHQIRLMIFHSSLPVLFSLLLWTTIRPIKLECERELRYLSILCKRVSSNSYSYFWERKIKE